MNWQDLKIYGMNALAMTVSFSNIENILKIILLIVSIIYTVSKILKNKE